MRGLIAAISGYAAVTYTYDVVFGMCNSAVDRMARDMAIELEPYNIASLSLWQGLTSTERAKRNLRRSPEMTNQTVTNPQSDVHPSFPAA
jgi:NAD(P)-dependent dehydrogenase (short-subunit alcohol dehydrogenase family)